MSPGRRRIRGGAGVDLGQDALYAANQAKSSPKVRFELNQPYTLGINEARYLGTTSIGLTLFQGQGASVDMLLKQSPTWRSTRPRERAAIRRDSSIRPCRRPSTRAWRRKRRCARRWASDEFQLYYQPQVNQDGKLIGAGSAALVSVRARDGLAGRIHPAGRGDRAHPVHRAVGPGHGLRPDQGLGTRSAYPVLQMAVNVSACRFHQSDFVATVQRSLAASGIDPSRLKLELTESVVLDNVDIVVSQMRQLNALGVGFCLDDFGTGYSSLSYLKRLPLRSGEDRSILRP